MKPGGRPPQAPPGAFGRLILGVRGRLLLLLLVAGIPVIGIAATNAHLNYVQALANGPRLAVMLREAAAARHGAWLEAMEELVRGLAERGDMATMPAAECAALAARLLALFERRYSNIWVTDAEGRVDCSGRPMPAAMQRLSIPFHDAVVARRDYMLGDFTTEPVNGREVIPGAAPVLQDGRVVRLVAAALLTDFFVETNMRAPSDLPHHIWFIDRRGTLVTLTRNDPADVPPPEILARLSVLGPPLTLEGRSRGGAAFAWSSMPLAENLRILIGLSTIGVQRAADDILRQRLLELTAFLLGCLLAIVVGGELAISRPLRSLAARVRAWRPGTPFGAAQPAGEPYEVRALEDAIAEAARALTERAAELQLALEQRDLLMAEMHHRVKNNLQIVASLLNLQAARLREPRARAEFASARDRVQALATLHRHLYTHQSFETILLKPFLEELTVQLFESLGEPPGERITLQLEAEPLEFSTDQAVSLALLITEALTNAVKHAFPEERRGTVSIIVAREGEDVGVIIDDDGIGGIAEMSEGDGIGFTLIRGFAAHLGGEVELEPRALGTRLVLRFPVLRRDSLEREAA